MRMSKNSSLSLLIAIMSRILSNVMSRVVSEGIDICHGIHASSI